MPTVFDETYITRTEFEISEQRRKEREAAAFARESDQREILNEVREGIREVVDWKNQMQGSLEDYKEIRRWVQNAQGGIIWGTSILLFLLGVIGWAFNHFFISPVLRHIRLG
jgi:hypothetical protein